MTARLGARCPCQWSADQREALIDEAYDRYGAMESPKHGGRFLGQPTAHIREELIDALRYAEMAEKQIAWLKSEVLRLNEAASKILQSGWSLSRPLQMLWLHPVRRNKGCPASN